MLILISEFVNRFHVHFIMYRSAICEHAYMLCIGVALISVVCVVRCSLAISLSVYFYRFNFKYILKREKKWYNTTMMLLINLLPKGGFTKQYSRGIERFDYSYEKQKNHSRNIIYVNFIISMLLFCNENTG